MKYSSLYLNFTGHICPPPITQTQSTVITSKTQAEAKRRIDKESIEKSGTLDLSGLKDLEQLPADIKKLKHLTSVNLSQTKIKTLKPIENLRKLQKVICNNTNISDLTPLSQLKNLEHLICYSTKITDLTALGELPSLRILDIAVTEITDLTPIAT
ncbi:MAG: hypothetical protein EOP84_17595, partial [Verrucomicrobiaceae bacterium]